MDRGLGVGRRRFASNRLVVVHLDDVLLEVSDPVLLHRQRTVELHLTEPGRRRREVEVRISGDGSQREEFLCHSPALQCVELAHQLDQRVGGWFGHQGGDGACA